MNQINATPSHLILNTIAMSHYSEKIRWLLDYEQLPYKEIVWTPVYHAFPALFRGLRGQTTVPFIYKGKTCIQNSPKIVDWLNKEYGLIKSLPASHQSEIIEVQSRFDAIGKPVARYLYFSGFEHKETVLDLWTLFSTPLQTIVIRSIYPLVKPFFKVKLKINRIDVARAESKIDEVLTWLEERLANNGDYLVGDQLSVADITAASLLAPLACPVEHPIYGANSFREKMSFAGSPFNGREGLAWVRRVYTKYRGTVWQQRPSSA